jgi:hypothetical protein
MLRPWRRSKKYQFHSLWLDLIGAQTHDSTALEASTLTITPLMRYYKLDKIGIFCFSAKDAALRRKSKDWLAWNQDNVSEWGDMSIQGMLLDRGDNKWTPEQWQTPPDGKRLHSLWTGEVINEFLNNDRHHLMAKGCMVVQIWNILPSGGLSLFRNSFITSPVQILWNVLPSGGVCHCSGIHLLPPLSKDHATFCHQVVSMNSWTMTDTTWWQKVA